MFSKFLIPDIRSQYNYLPHAPKSLATTPFGTDYHITKICVSVTPEAALTFQICNTYRRRNVEKKTVTSTLWKGIKYYTGMFVYKQQNNGSKH